MSEDILSYIKLLRNMQTSHSDSIHCLCKIFMLFNELIGVLTCPTDLQKFFLQCSKLFGIVKKATDVSPTSFDDLSSCIALTLWGMVICIDDFTFWSISINIFVSSESAIEIFMSGSN